MARSQPSASGQAQPPEPSGSGHDGLVAQGDEPLVGLSLRRRHQRAPIGLRGHRIDEPPDGCQVDGFASALDGSRQVRRLSYEWLAGLREIVIDPKRCPLTFSEFTLKEFERDKEGNWIDEIPDGNDHSIDAVRYALMSDMLCG